ncbi:MAG TPA: RNA-binding protein [Candidatus Paceibacterota bacterium]
MQENKKKLFVGGIPWASTEEDVRKAFEEAGTVVSVSLPIDRMYNRPRGFGFVEMATEAEAQAAVERWDGKDFGGRTLKVDFARPESERPPRENRGGGRGGFGGDRGGYGSY